MNANHRVDINKIKEDLLDWLKNNSTKNLFSYFRNKQEDLQQIKDEINNRYNFIPTNLAELCYLILREDIVQVFCKYQNKKNFKTFQEGYAPFCGIGKKCSCRIEYLRNKSKEVHQSKSEEEKRKIKEKREKTCIERYGTPNPSQVEEFKKKRIETFLNKYNVECSLQSEKIKQKIKKTNLERYGTEKPSQNEQIKRKIKETNLKKYGVENPSQNREIKQKIKETNLKKYGVENVFQSEIIKTKTKITNLKKYGVEHHLKNEDIKNKQKATNLIRYKHETPLQNEEIKRKMKETNLKKYGTSAPAQNTEIKNKIKETNLKRYGFETSAKNEQVKQKIKMSFLKKYGVSSPLQNEEIKRKIKESFLQKYGVENPSKNEKIKTKIKEKSRETFLKKYNVFYPTKLPEIKQKIKETNLKKYGIEWISQRNLSKDVLQKINDPEWLRYQHHELKKSGIEIGKELGLSESVICKRLNKFGIPVFSYTRSHGEKEIEKFLLDLGYRLEITNRKKITPYELDIFVVDKNIAIEYCGLYWHNEENKGKRYHLDKLERCLEKGIRLVTLFENEWVFDQENTKKKLLWILNEEENRLYENEIGKEKILVDRRWGEGLVLKEFGYKLVEKLEPKKWAFIGQNLLEEWSLDMKDEIDFIWDCGWLVYEKR